jgi:hypothetical protein
MIFLAEFRVYSIFVVGLISFCGRIWGQHVLPSARLKPLDNSEVAIARKGQAVFLDAVGPTFNRIPTILKGSAFLKTSRTAGCAVVPLTTGKIIVATPVKGHDGSQDSALTEKGFEPLGAPLTKLLAGHQDALQMYTKQVDYNSFRLSPLSFKSWVIIFFSPDSLPSRLVSANLTTSILPKYNKKTRQWQGCPSIEKTGKRLWAAWFSGGNREPDSGNYGIVSYSDDGGSTWDDPTIIITHRDTGVRVMDPQLWKDPAGKLWIFWVQNEGAHGFDGMWSTWAVQILKPESGKLAWTKPRRLCNGLTRNKPIVLGNGDWLLPSYSWVPDYRSALYISKDKGKSWLLQGGPVNDGSQNFYEHMVVELKDKKLWLLQRNIQQSYSSDRGKTWTNLDTVEEMTSANSRLYFGRLQSGSLLLVYNNDEERKTRRNLTAFLSRDDGKTWPHKLLIDERINVSYPDVTQDAMGRIFLIYDRGRNTDKEIILSQFTEEDVIKGRLPDGYNPKMVSKVE